MIRQSLLVLLLTGCAGQVHALSIQLDTANTSAPPEITYTKGGGLPLRLTLQVVNDSELDSAPILLWQLGLTFQPALTTIGDARFGDVLLADNSLFGSSSMPSTGSELPTSAIVVSDTDPAFQGISVSPKGAKNIVTLPIDVSGDASGDFVLIMSGYTASDPDNSSFWIPQSNDLSEIPFDNPTSASNPGVIELAVLHVVNTALVGDYNNNGIVDAADYTVWRDTLGQMVTRGTAADGDFSGVIDPGDYAAWKSNFGRGSGLATAVPEPPLSVWFGAAAVLVGLRMCRLGPRRRLSPTSAAEPSIRRTDARQDASRAPASHDAYTRLMKLLVRDAEWRNRSKWN